MAIDPRFIGRGWSFPPQFVKSAVGGRGGESVMAEGIEDIRQALWIIVTTTLGERLMRPTFGCNIEDHLFEPMNRSFLSYTEALVRSAILHHEPRIDAQQITVESDQPAGRLHINIGYTVRGTNSRFNMVLPYYLNAEG